MNGISCGKVRYPSELAAKIALLNINRNDTIQEKRAYSCPRCLGWHLTSQDKAP